MMSNWNYFHFHRRKEEGRRGGRRTEETKVKASGELRMLRVRDGFYVIIHTRATDEHAPEDGVRGLVKETLQRECLNI